MYSYGSDRAPSVSNMHALAHVCAGTLMVSSTSHICDVVADCVADALVEMEVEKVVEIFSCRMPGRPADTDTEMLLENDSARKFVNDCVVSLPTWCFNSSCWGADSLLFHSV